MAFAFGLNLSVARLGEIIDENHIIIFISCL